ncbi:hypothetical protein EK21DRAFT_106465 [Setomelanomma holmii]|uniref:C3H1-type domain-containing protein n=1 Tax=Setomelanomma holmii TaxID=210430 RepID=A0A9P4LU16_9PLEO|nr:hypothetical protein EK21DRAFT_106465 [Setomelanomma holmii]
MGRHNCKCPLNLIQDGVCGCPQFWSRKASHTPLTLAHQSSTTPTPQTPINSQRSRSPFYTPVGPPRETCFFWYHGTCRRGQACTHAHETHATWQITPPPGYVHYEKCKLPMCPLRWDLVGVRAGGKEKEKEGKMKGKGGIGGQLDGATLSFVSSGMVGEVGDGDGDEDKEIGAEYTGKDMGVGPDCDGDHDGECDVACDMNPSNTTSGGEAVLLSKDDSEDTDTGSTHAETEEGSLNDITNADVYQTPIEISSSDEECENSDSSSESSDNDEEQENVSPLRKGVEVIEITDSESSSEDSESNTNDDIEEQENSAGLIDPDSRAMNGSYSDDSDSDINEMEHEAALSMTVKPEGSPSHMAAATVPSSAHGLDYVDMTCYTPPPPSSDTEKSPLLSLSHPGTLKRKRTTSPEFRSNNSDFKRIKRESTPDLDRYLSILQRERPESHWDERESGSLERLPTSTSTSPTSQTCSLPPKPAPQPNDFVQSNNHHPKTFNTRSHAPTSPRAVTIDGSLVCFYWYHEGYCKPKRGRNGRPIRCTYAHTLDVKHARVSLPPGIDRHDLECDLPMCPVRLGKDGYDGGDTGGKRGEYLGMKVGMRDKVEHDTPMTYGYFSSIPRTSVSETRASVQRLQYSSGSPQNQRLPPLTGTNAQELTTRNRSINGRQYNPEKMQKHSTNEVNKRNRRQLKLQKRRETNDLNYGNEAKHTQLSSQSAELHEAAANSEGNDEMLQKNAELYEINLSIVADTQDGLEKGDVRNEMEARQSEAGSALGMAHLLKEDEKTRTWTKWSPAKTARLREKKEKRRGHLKGERNPEFPARKARSKVRIVVDYDLPQGKDRLPWDTDHVRWVFGEIEYTH